MARKGSNKPSSKRRRSASEIALYILSVIIILSMTIGFVISLLPDTAIRQPIPTSTPTLTREATATSTLATVEPSPNQEGTPQPNQ